MKKFVLFACALFLCGIANAQSNKFEKNIEANIGIGLDNCTNYSLGLNFIGGYRASNHFFIGAGIGYAYLDGLYYSSYEYLGKGDSDNYSSYDGRSNMQLFARAKVNLTKTNVSPFLSLDLGGTFGLTSNSIKMANGFIYEPAFGCDFKFKDKGGMYIMIGYKGMQYSYRAFNLTYGDTSDETRKKMAGMFNIHIGFKF